MRVLLRIAPPHRRILLVAPLILLIGIGLPTLAGNPAQAAQAPAEAAAPVCPSALIKGTVTEALAIRYGEGATVAEANNAATAIATDTSSEAATAEPTTGAPTPPELLSATGCTLAATLRIPGLNGKTKGWGSAVFDFDPVNNKICYAIHVGGIKLPILAAHLHYNSGRVAMTLQTPASGETDACTDANPALIKDVIAHPAGYFVNIHNADYPTGGIRGPLLGAVLLQGADEIPPGDPKGWGSATFIFDPDQGKVCYEVDVAAITLPGTANHIHKGKPGTAGPTVVNLTPPDQTGHISDCTAADPTLINDILTNPTGYYTNVHNVDFPKSALRGNFTTSSETVANLDTTSAAVAASTSGSSAFPLADNLLLYCVHDVG